MNNNSGLVMEKGVRILNNSWIASLKAKKIKTWRNMFFKGRKSSNENKIGKLEQSLAELSYSCTKLEEQMNGQIGRMNSALEALKEGCGIHVRKLPLYDSEAKELVIIAATKEYGIYKKKDFKNGQ